MVAKHLNEALADNTSRAEDPRLPLFFQPFRVHVLISVVLR
jgi:hypothetical protein